MDRPPPDPDVTGRPPRASFWRRFPRLGFIALILFLALAAAYTSVLIVERQQSLRAISRYNVSWLVSQAALEVARLQSAIGQFRIEPDEDNRDAVQLWLDIVANRALLLAGGDVWPFIRADPEREATVAQLRRAIATAQPLMARLDEDGVADRLLSAFTELNPRLTRLASAAYSRGNELVSGDLEHLGRLHWIFSGVLITLIICCTGLIATLTYHNRLVRNANREVNALVHDLTRTGRQLAAAKEQAQEAMGEVQQQYRALRLRDAELNVQNDRFDAALNNMSQALCMFSAEHRLIVCNVRFLDLFGLGESFVGPGATRDELFQAMAAGGRFDPALLEAIRHAQEQLVADAAPRDLLPRRLGRPGHRRRPPADGRWRLGRHL